MTLVDDARTLPGEPAGRPRPRPPLLRDRLAWARSGRWLVGTLAWSLGCVYLLNTSTFVGRSESPYITTNYVWLAGLAVNGKPAGTLVVWLVLVLAAAFSGRTWVALALTLDLTLLLGAVNAVKLRIRAEPISPADLDFLGNPVFLLDMVSARSIMAGIAVLVLVPLAIWWIARRRRGTERERRRALNLLGRAVAVLVCVALLASTRGFNEPGNAWRAVFDADITRWSHWSQHENFMKNGFVAGVLYDMPVEPMDKPAGYTRERMDEIVATYAAAAAATNASRGATGLDETNVVLVLSESFSDPTRLDGFSLPVDPLPTTRKVMDETTSGPLLVGGYGGGTANVEFELLTGMSLSFFAPQLSIPYQQLVTNDERFPSLVRWFSEHGHDTVAVHPFSGEMYRRSEVYPRLGFDEFVDDQTLDSENRSRTGTFVDDTDAFDEVVGQLREHERPLLAHLVTMQNHYPYDGEYPDPLPVEAGTAAEERSIGQYARGVANSDEALGQFLDDVRALPEPTVVVFYGDHLPGIYSGDVMQENGPIAMRQTPFFLWRNDRPPEAAPQPVTSPNQLVPLLFDMVDAPEPAYVALLDAVRTQVTAVQRGAYVLPDGSVSDQETDLPAGARQILEDYQLVQYDLAVGHRWSEAGLLGD